MRVSVGGSECSQREAVPHISPGLCWFAGSLWHSLACRSIVSSLPSSSCGGVLREGLCILVPFYKDMSLIGLDSPD